MYIKENSDHKFFKFYIVLVIVLVVAGYFILNTGSANIFKKNLQADMMCGLERTVTVYSATGVPIRTWSGRIDLDKSEHEVNMIIDGKRRVIIKSGTTIVEEK